MYASRFADRMRMVGTLPVFHSNLSLKPFIHLPGNSTHVCVFLDLFIGNRKS